MSTNSSNNVAPPGKIAGNEFKKNGYTLFIAISADKMECRCSYVPHEQGAMMRRDEFNGYLKLMEVRFGIDEQAADDFVEKAAARIFQRDVLLAQGIAPVNGTDAYLKYLVTPSLESHYAQETADQVDMRAIQTFMNVSPGEHVARIISHVVGAPGKNVNGIAIPHTPGKPLQLKIGKNLTFDAETGQLTSESAGRLCRNLREISVEEVYSIRGNVDLNIGSIIHKGIVSISGDVLDGFNVTAAKSVSIGGNAGACSISSKGDVTLCGMDGQRRGVILCEGTLRARFLHDSYIECAGDILVDAEIRNCTILCLGRIVVNRGEIAGGRYTALGGIEANRIGLPNSIRTNILVGVHYLDEEEKLRLNSTICSIQLERNDATDPQQTDSLRVREADLSDSFSEICSRRYDQCNPKVNVKQMIYGNTFVTIGNARREIREEMAGPLSLIENTIAGGLRKLDMSSLDIKAQDIEQGFIRGDKIKRAFFG